MNPHRFVVQLALGLALCLASCRTVTPAWGFVPDERWSRTSAGTTGDPGDPITLTWSFVPDGTLIPDQNTGSDLIGFLDGLFGAGAGGDDLTARPWFRFFDESFARWSSLGGLTYAYEPADDGSRHGQLAGQRGVRGDVRIGGAFIDGEGNVLAYNQLPNGGDMVLDTGDASFFGNAAGDYLRLRNVIMHEHGHGLGLLHVESNTDALLMEPFINTNIDGPQLDEVRGVHFFYGDANEKASGRQGNDAAPWATELGDLGLGGSVSVGAGADSASQRIAVDATDFVSIDRLSDVDYYAFSLAEPGLLDATLTPRGGVFNQTSQGGAPTEFDANARVDLVLELLGAGGSQVLAQADAQAAGGVEQFQQFALERAGQYYVRVSGKDDSIQLYQLDLRVAAPVVSYDSADFNQDGTVDDLDLEAWTVADPLSALADATSDGRSDGLDWLVWQREFGRSTALQVDLQSLPEPTTWAGAIWAAASIAAGRRRGRCGQDAACRKRYSGGREDRRRPSRAATPGEAPGQGGDRRGRRAAESLDQPAARFDAASATRCAVFPIR